MINHNKGADIVNKKFIRFTSLLIAVLMVFSLCACGAEEDETYDYKSPVPTTVEEIVARFNEAVAGAKSGNPGISYSIKQSAKMSGDQKDKCDNEYIKAAFKTLEDAITEENFSEETAYGESTKDIFPTRGSDVAPVLTVADVRSAYVAENKDDGTGASYKIVIKLYAENDPENGDDGAYGKLYNIMKDEEILSNFDVVSSVVSVESYSTQYGIGTITATLKKDTDQLTDLSLSRDVVVTAEVTGVGTLSDLGTVPLEFNYSATENYSIDWFDPATKND